MQLKQYISRGIRYVLTGVRPVEVKADIKYLSPSGALEGKKIIITGGGRGLGYAMAEKFIKEGATVLIAGRNEETLRKASSTLGCKYLKLDLQDIKSFDAFVEHADEMLGGVNCLVNNAGISLHENTVYDVTPDSFDAQINTNLKGAFFMSQKCLAVMEKNNRQGNILFVSSETGDTADIRPYGFTKAAINSLVKGLASLMAKKGIRVNAVAPGITTSDMTGFKAEGNLYCAGNATDRVYLPGEVAEVASFLLSDASGCMSGQILVCNNAKTVNPRWK
jgi:3-oxoacyl-[acyl-carrier protein] reductase